MDLLPRLIELGRASASRRSTGSGGNQADDANDLGDYICSSALLTKHMVDFELKRWPMYDCIDLGCTQNAGLALSQGHVILILLGHYLDGAQLESSQICSSGQALCMRFGTVGWHFVRDFVHTVSEAEASCHLCYSFLVPPALKTRCRSQQVFLVQVQRHHDLAAGASLAGVVE